MTGIAAYFLFGCIGGVWAVVETCDTWKQALCVWLAITMLWLPLAVAMLVWGDIPLFWRSK